MYAIGNFPFVMISLPLTCCLGEITLLFPNTSTNRTTTAIARMALKMSDKFFIRLVSLIFYSNYSPVIRKNFYKVSAKIIFLEDFNTKGSQFLGK